MSYKQLTRFLLPLVLTIFIQELSGQVLNGGMARMPRATETLAGYGLAWGLVYFLSSGLSQTRQLGLVLVDSRSDLHKTWLFVALAGLVLAGILASLSLTPVGNWVIEGLHDVHPPLSDIVRTALFWLIPVPLITALIRYHSGLLLRVRRSDLVSYATLTSIAACIVTVFALLPTDLIQAKPIRLPILAIYAGSLTELGVLLWGCWGYMRQLPPTGPRDLAFSYILRFYWPLALIMSFQALSRPIINLFVSRGPDGTEALAVLTVVYALGHLPYGWVNEIRNLPPAFRDTPNSLPHIRRFAAACGLISFASMVTLFWTPLRDVILLQLIGVDQRLATLARAPLILFSFFPLTVMVRAYFHGVGLLEHRTSAMAPSAPSRILAILVMLAVLPASHVHGATRGVAALLSGFTTETIVVWWGVRGQRLLRKRAPADSCLEQ